MTDGVVQDYRPDIDGLRAVAVLAVMAFHFFPRWVPGGFLGVDIFFVISGFLISGILLRGFAAGSLRLRTFYARRMRRIFPALALVLTACLAAGWLTLLNREYVQLGTHVAAGAGFVSNFILWKEAGYFDLASELKPLLHLWSLGVEEQFYLLWPAMLLIAWRLRVNRLLLIAGLMIASLAWALLEARAQPVAAFYSPMARFWELMIGGALAHVRIFQPRAVDMRPMVRQAAAVVGALAVGVALWSVHRDATLPGWFVPAAAVGAALLIAAGPHTWLNRVGLANPVCVWIGLISYPLYLWHWPLLAFVRIVDPQWLRPDIRLVLAVTSVALAWLTWRFIERPVRSGRVPVPAVACALAVAGGAGLWASRLDPEAMSARYMLPNLEMRLLLDDPHQFSTAVNCVLTDFGGVEPGVRPAKCARQASDPKLLLLGDSHVGQYYAGLQTVGASSIVIFTGGCPPVHGFTVADKRCDERWGVLEQFAERQRARSPVVLISGFYSSYVYPAALNELRDHGFGSDYLPQYQDVDPSTFPARFAAAVADSARAFRRMGLRVGVLLDTPDFVNSTRDCLATGGDTCLVDRRLIVSRQAFVREAVERLHAEDPGVQIFDPLPWLCGPDTCSEIIDGTLAYWNDNHLNVYGSRLLAGHLLRWVHDRFGE